MAGQPEVEIKFHAGALVALRGHCALDVWTEGDKACRGAAALSPLSPHPLAAKPESLRSDA